MTFALTLMDWLKHNILTLLIFLPAIGAAALPAPTPRARRMQRRS